MTLHFLDLSQPIIAAGPNCPAHPLVESRLGADHPEHGWRWETLTLASHTGSHLDAPLHKLAGGASIDSLPLDRFAGDAYIVNLRPIGSREWIAAARLEELLPALPPDSIVLLSTGWGDRRERSDDWLYGSPRLAPDAARWLVDRSIRGLGIDHWGIGGWDRANDAEVHTILLEASIWICEELRLPAEVCQMAMPQQFVALPINLPGHTGAWCRPVLVMR